MDSLIRFGTILACCFAGAVAQAQTIPALKPGVTVWVYDTGEEMRELPVLVDGQTPNVSADFDTIDFSTPWESTYGTPLAEHYVGHAWGRMVISTGGTYEFRLTSDDGAKWFLG
ncbi:MAG: hypothetical protein EOP83_21320, partial [Verrucomicrobiaceae bacterium]